MIWIGAGIVVVLAVELVVLARVERLHRILDAHGRRLGLIRQAISEREEPAPP